MSVKKYGSCSGSSGSKYNIWLEINENSQNIEKNTSNITVDLRLKRNDKYSSSAYNLNKNDNSAKITINAVEKVNTNLVIDTRNSAVVLLATWTGDIVHNDDGTLTVPISGSFTMSGTTLSGGVVNTQFNCVSIPRVSTFVLSKSFVVPEENVTLQITPASVSFSHSVILEMGPYKYNLPLSPGEKSLNLSVPCNWVNAIPNARNGFIKITLKTYSNSNIIGDSVQYLKLVVPDTDDYLPKFSYEKNFDNAGKIPGIWRAYLQNVTTLTIDVDNIDLKYGAVLSSCVVKIGNQTKNGLKNNFDLTESGVLKGQIIITDSRGFKKEAIFFFEVDNYEKPMVICSDIYRCDASGVRDEKGTFAAIDFEKIFSRVRGLNICNAYVKYRKNNSTEFSEPILLNNSPFIINDSFDVTSSYIFVISVSDSVTSNPYEVTRELSTGYISFNIKKGGNGAAFGCYSETVDELTIGYDLNVMGSLKFKSINADIVARDTVEFLVLDVKKYDCLRMIAMNIRLKLLTEFKANTLNELFVINNLGILNTYPLPVHYDGYLTIDGVMHAFLNSSGVVKILNAPLLKTGTTLNINTVFCY